MAFWIDKSSTPEKVSIAIITALTMQGQVSPLLKSKLYAFKIFVVFNRLNSIAQHKVSEFIVLFFIESTIFLTQYLRVSS